MIKPIIKENKLNYYISLRLNLRRGALPYNTSVGCRLKDIDPDSINAEKQAELAVREALWEFPLVNVENVTIQKTTQGFKVFVSYKFMDNLSVAEVDINE